MKYNTKIESVDAVTMEKALNSCVKYIEKKPTEKDKVSRNAYYWLDNRENYHLIFRDYHLKRIRHFVFDTYSGQVDESYALKYRAGYKAWMRIKKYAKEYDEEINFKDNDQYTKYSWKPYEYLDPMNCNKHIKAWEYDSNSNYLSKMSMPLPYGDIIRRDDFVKNGEIGFNIVGNGRWLETVFKGPANIIFKTKVYKSLSKFAKVSYVYRQTLEKGSTEEKMWKTIICAAHGNLKSHNIFIATAIIGYSSEEIKHYNKYAHVYMNTVDSIICDRPIDCIPLGTELGQFKLKHENEDFIYRSHGIKEWESGEVKYKGVKKTKLEFLHPQYVMIKGEIYKYEQSN